MPARIIAVLVAIAVAATNAHAHTGAGIHSGFLHPLLGWDHVIAMIGVGAWAACLGGQAIWRIPLSFVAAMIAGGVLGFSGVALPFAELTILASVVVIAGLWLLKVKMPGWAGMVVVGLFAIAHGYAHGTEMPMDTSPVLFAFGFVIATGLLHALGMCLGLWQAKRSGKASIR